MIPVTSKGRHYCKKIMIDEQIVSVDKDIADTIEMCSKLGIRTTGSCHGHCSFNCWHKRKNVLQEDGYYCSTIVETKRCYDNMWLVFYNLKDIEKFYNVVADFNNEKMYKYIKGIHDRKDRTTAWAVKTFAENHGETYHMGRPTFNGKRVTQDMFILDGCEKNKFTISPQLTFPREHISYIEDKLSKALKGK